MNTPALDAEVRSLVDRGDILLSVHARLAAPSAALGTGLADAADKIEGMMIGLAIGDALGNTSESLNPDDRRRIHGWIDGYLPNRHAGQRRVGLPSDDSQLAFWTIESLLAHRPFDPQALGALFASRRHAIYGGGRATAAALEKLAEGKHWSHSGSPRASNGALMRIAAMLLPHVARPRATLWTDTLASAHLTHADLLSNTSCLVFVDLLATLLPMREAPPAQWWFDFWQQAFEDLGGGGVYRTRSEHPPGFEGSVVDLLRSYVRPALDTDLDVDAAGDVWHSGAYLLETVPTVVYILARHGHDPRAAVLQAVNGTRDNDTIAAIVGAAMGALHGLAAWPEAWLDGLPGRTGSADDAEVFRLLLAAGECFGYGVSPRLRSLASRATRT